MSVKINLTISQPTDKIEQVSSAIIDKLYQLAYGDGAESQLTSTSDVKGTIQANEAYEDAIRYLAGIDSGDTPRFANLHINVAPTNYFVRFRDEEFARIAIQKWGNGKSGCIVSDVVSVQSLGNDFNNNSLIKTLDLAKFKGLGSNPKVSGCVNLKNIYIGKCVSVSTGFESNLSLNKFIIGECRTFLGESTNNKEIGIFGIKDLTANANNVAIGNYIFRSITIGEMFIGSELPPILNTGYGDDVNNAGTIYVPDKTVTYNGTEMTCAEAYALADNWKAHTAGYEPYDFDLDPRGIFKELK